RSSLSMRCSRCCSMPSVSDDTLIEVEDLTIGYGGRPVLEPLAVSVALGDVFAILGGSGPGKTTLLRHPSGREQPSAGTVPLGGSPPARESVAPQYGVLFQSGALFGSMTLFDNVALPLRTWTNLDPTAIDTIVRSKLRLVGLEGFEHHLPAEISGGMKK